MITLDITGTCKDCRYIDIAVEVRLPGVDADGRVTPLTAQAYCKHEAVCKRKEREGKA